MIPPPAANGGAALANPWLPMMTDDDANPLLPMTNDPTANVRAVPVAAAAAPAVPVAPAPAVPTNAAPNGAANVRAIPPPPGLPMDRPDADDRDEVLAMEVLNQHEIAELKTENARLRKQLHDITSTLVWFVEQLNEEQREEHARAGLPPLNFD